jgi:hypothetical protein
MAQSIKKFFKPDFKKIILFLILFSAAFYKLPFVKEGMTETGRSVSWLIKNYSGDDKELSLILSGFGIYFIVFYFISCAIIILWDDFRDKKR